jgi:VWFA-related protein
MEGEWRVRLGRPSSILSKVAIFVSVAALSYLPSLRAQTPSASSQALVSQNPPTTFKLRVNLILVRVVVRDSDGKPVQNLQKEDFQLTDAGKLQAISTFSVETPASRAATFNIDSGEPASTGIPAKVPAFPQRFVTLFFDDLHLSIEDAMIARKVATKLLASMQPGDRFAVTTTSGQVDLDFTADRAKLDQNIQGIMPHTKNSPLDCPS